MSEQHCPGCHGHIYDELDGFDPCDEHGRWGERTDCPGRNPSPKCERLAASSGLYSNFPDVRVTWAHGQVCNDCSHALCRLVRSLQSDHSKLDAEITRLAECRCTDHWDAPAVDGCAVCVRERLAAAVELLRGWAKLSTAIADLDAGKREEAER